MVAADTSSELIPVINNSLAEGLFLIQDWNSL